MEGARPATAEDAERVAQLAAQAIEELLPTRGGDMFAVREARLQPPKVPDPGTWVGTIDGTVIGYAAGRIEHLRDGRRLGVVDDLYVEAEARGVSVGEALLDALLGWFSDEGCAGVDAHALPGNRATKNFFEAAGFTARLLVMHHRLPPAELS